MKIEISLPPPLVKYQRKVSTSIMQYKFAPANTCAFSSTANSKSVQISRHDTHKRRKSHHLSLSIGSYVETKRRMKGFSLEVLRKYGDLNRYRGMGDMANLQ